MTSNLRRFLNEIGRETLILPFRSEEDPDLRWFVWITDVPRPDLCGVEDGAVDLALSIYGPAPLDFLIGVATPEKTRVLREGLHPRPAAGSELAPRWQRNA